MCGCRGKGDLSQHFCRFVNAVGPDTMLNDQHEAYIVPASAPQSEGRSTYEALAQHDGSLANLLQLSQVCGHAFLLRAVTASPPSLYAEFAFDNDE